MKHIKNFENVNAADGWVINNPFVSGVEGEDLIYCNEPNKKLKLEGGHIVIANVGPEIVDLGLPSGILWTANNVGAEPGSTPESYYGYYYAWGETETKSKYDWNNYTFGTKSPFSKYDTDGKTVLEAIDDVATAIYGSDYRMPTEDEIRELKALPNQWVTNYNGVSGLNGRVFTGTNGNTLFIPAAGYFGGSSVQNANINGNVWSSSLVSGSPYDGRSIFVRSDGTYIGTRNRDLGYSVRAVKSI